MHIVVIDDFENALSILKNSPVVQEKATIDIYSDRLLGDDLLKALKPADVIVMNRDRTPLRKPLIDQLPNLKYVVFTGSRNLLVDYDVLEQKNIPISFTEFGPSKETTVELTWALILAAYKRVGEQSHLIEQGKWRNNHSVLPALIGERLGVLGLGNIGAKVAKVGVAFGMDVVTWSPNMTPERAAQHGVMAVSKEELLSTSKIVTLHLVPGETTRGIINADTLSLMRKDSLLVNTSRSTLINTQDLVLALKNGQPGMAALDVYDDEPLPMDHPFRQLSNILMTPHLGFVSEPVYKRLSQGALMAVEAWLKGDTLVNIVKK
jgi:phosphoglycerate dehydrogenase-like enzyme